MFFRLLLVFNLDVRVQAEGSSLSFKMCPSKSRVHALQVFLCVHLGFCVFDDRLYIFKLYILITTN